MISDTHAVSTIQYIPTRSGSQGLGSLLKSWWDAYWTLRAQRATALVLRSLDDHSLHDIGLDRSEIESVVYGKSGDRRVRYEHNWQ
jgi:uncharacterized protein YjiS (DUF1127 family)